MMGCDAVTASKRWLPVKIISGEGKGRSAQPERAASFRDQERTDIFAIIWFLVWRQHQ